MRSYRLAQLLYMTLVLHSGVITDLYITMRLDLVSELSWKLKIYAD